MGSVMVVVWTNGCFDVLHRGHFELFRFAKKKGNKLIVGLDSDEKIKKDKGESRPFFILEDRIFALNSIKYIDKIVSYNSNVELENKIKECKPNIIVVGSDYYNKKVIGSEYVDKVVFFEKINNYSTSFIIGK